MNINNFPMIFPISPSLNVSQMQNMNHLLYLASSPSISMHPSLSQQPLDLKQRFEGTLPSIPYQGMQTANNLLNPLQNYTNLIFSGYGDHLKGYLNQLSSSKTNPLLINKSNPYFSEGKYEERKITAEQTDKTIQRENNIEKNKFSAGNHLSSLNNSTPETASQPIINEGRQPDEKKSKSIIEKITKKVKKIEDSSSNNSESEHDVSDGENESLIHEDEAYIPNNRRIKKSIESTPKRILRDRMKQPIEKKETPEIIQNKFANLIQELEVLLEYQDIDKEKLMQLFIKVDYDPQKIITKVKRSRTYYRKYFKLSQPAPSN